MNRILWYLTSTLALVSVGSGLAIGGQETVEIQAGDEVVTVIARGVHAAGSLKARGDRIEVELDAGATRTGRADLDDETVKRAELLADPARLSIVVHHSKRSTELTAANSRVEIRNGALVITMPRNPHKRLSRGIETDQAAEAAKPVKPAHVAKAETKIEAKTEAKIEPKAEAKPEAKIEPKAETKIEAKPEPKIETKPEPAAPATAAKADPKQAVPVAHASAPVAAPAPEAAKEPIAVPTAVAATAEPIGVPDSGRNPIWITLGILGASVVLLFWLQRRKQKTGTNIQDPLRLIAQRQLNAKSKMVLVEAHGREILVAVSNGRPVLLGKWKVERREIEHDDDDAESLADLESMRSPTPKPRAARRTTPAPTGTSPSVAGILKLRGPQAQVRPPARPSLDETQEDLDAEWAQELMQATSKRRS